MDFRIEHRVGVRASTDRIWEVIGDLPGWNAWNPVLTDVEGRIVIGGELTLTERIEGLPERRVTARINDWTPYAQLIWSEKRGWQFNGLRYFEIEELAPGSCIVAVGEILSGLRGESHYGKHRRKLKAACETMGEAIRARAEA